MQREDFTHSPGVVAILRDLRAAIGTKHFSDFTDGENNQYVDLVMEGGGVLGIALVGYTYVLEEMGIRFLRIAGTSAGAINALLLAALGPPAEPKSERIAEALANLRLWRFLDGGGAVRRLAAAFIRGAWIHVALWGIVGVYRVFRFLGLNPGREFTIWLEGVLAERGVRTGADLTRMMRTLPAGFGKRGGGPLTIEDADPYLAIVAADITTETKVEFPRMARLYWADPEKENPASFVRASMSIPYVFQPCIQLKIPRGDKARVNWMEDVKYGSEIPEVCVLVDGGIMSNFPIDLFHSEGEVPPAPTFGVKLGSRKRLLQRSGNPFSLGGSVFNAARHTLDYDFITRHPDYHELVAYVDTSNFHWLNFGMTDREKIDLFIKGAEAAAEFLKRFDWEKYKEIRAGMAQAQRAASGATRGPMRGVAAGASGSD